jgi:hypothetical protein
LGVLESGWNFKTNKVALHALQALRAEFSSLSIYKVPAHCGIEGNEEADTLANVGTSLSPPLISPRLFAYLVQAPHGKRAHPLPLQPAAKRARISPPNAPSKRPLPPSQTQNYLIPSLRLTSSLDSDIHPPQAQTCTILILRPAYSPDRDLPVQTQTCLLPRLRAASSPDWDLLPLQTQTYILP